VPLRRRWGLNALLYTKPSTTTPRTCVGETAPAGGRRRASRRLNSVRTSNLLRTGVGRASAHPNALLSAVCRAIGLQSKRA
jgi:hypothetical protein